MIMYLLFVCDHTYIQSGSNANNDKMILILQQFQMHNIY